MIYVRHGALLRRMMEMCERLRAARKKAGFDSASEAAKRFGWTKSTYLAHENGQNFYNAETAEIYAKAFDTEAEWLLLGISRASDPLAHLRDEITELPPELSRQVIEEFNRLIATVKLARKIK